MPISIPVKRRPVIVGNWKMNGLARSEKEITALTTRLMRAKGVQADVVICPPATLLPLFRPLVKGTPLSLGAQDCHAKPGGAHTGDLSAPMLKDAGAKWIIVGHSERRTSHGETDDDVKAKAHAALIEKMRVIICVGETETERGEGKTLGVIERQLARSLPDFVDSKNTVIAYEPVWAIGTGRTPMLKDIDDVHQFIRQKLVDRFDDDGNHTRILYGGSVKPRNAAEIMSIADVDGTLVGGASLRANEFWQIIQAGRGD